MEEKNNTITSITFDEFVQYGRSHGGNIVNGMPWSFEYKGYAITHEDDNCYLICTKEGIARFTRNDILINDTRGNLFVYNVKHFQIIYDMLEKERK